MERFVSGPPHTCSDSSTITVSEESECDRISSEGVPTNSQIAEKSYLVRKALHDSKKGRPLSLEQLLSLEARKLEGSFSSKDQMTTRLSG